MNRYLLAVNPFFAVALALLVAGSCNAFEFMYEEGDSSDPEVILQDARIALQKGDTQKAIDLLEKALETAPENVEIRIELSSALFQGSDIDLLTMKELADFISNAEPNIVAGKNTSNQSVCNFSQSPASTRILEFETTGAYLTLHSSQEVIARALELLSENSQFEASSELASHLTGNAYLIRAIASMGKAILDIKKEVDASDATLHQLSNGSIGYCAPDPASLSHIEEFVLCRQLPMIDSAIDDLISRQESLGIEDSELVDAVELARDEFNNTTSAACTLFYPTT